MKPYYEYGPMPDDMRVTHVKVAFTGGGRHAERFITLEEFAKLFEPITITDGKTFSRQVIRVAPTGSADK